MPEQKTTANLVDDLAEEFAHRWRGGERPSVEEYARRFPQLADEIRAVLPAVVMMEQLKPRSQDAKTAATSAAGSERLPERVGEYRIVREIGRGGMGVVYEADEQALGRRVAIKVLPGHLVADEKSRARFGREAQAAARLHHTSIVPVFAVGESDGQCYYVMQLIEGRGLDRIIRETAAAAPDKSAATARALCRTAARIGAQVADALAYAHAQGVLHRDIKPSNLLMDDRDGVWVTDFGVAKVVEATNLTESGDFIGTLKYMPPERFAGQSDARGDVYSLGVTLYELLTLRSPFPDTNPQHLIQLITHDTPTRPRRLNPEIPRDLETIVLKAAARDPAQRYQTPGELAEDLRRFLYDRPILAKRTSLGEQLWRWCRRNPALSGVTAAALLLLVAITVVSVVAYAQTASANRDMQKALTAEKTQRDHAENTAALALEALNRTYDRFAPTRLVVAPPASNEEGVELPPRPAAIPPEAAALLEDLLRTYEQIAHSSSKFPRLHAQVAEANHRIGDIRRRLGRFEEAAAAYEIAIGLYRQLLAEEAKPQAADTDAVRVKLARACNDLGRTLHWLQKFDDAKRMHESAVATLMEAPKALADRPECRYELACSYFALGERDFFLNKGGPGPPELGKKPPPFGKDKMPPFGKGKPPPPDKGMGKKGDKETGRQGDKETGRKDSKGDQNTWRAVGLLEELVGEFPAVPEYRHLLACCYRDLPPGPPGGGPKPGKASPDRAVDLLQKLVEDFPNVPDYRFDLCETLARKGPPGGPKGASQEAANRMRLNEAIRLSAELVTNYPSVPEYAAARARYFDRLGMLLYDAENYQEAEPAHRKAVAFQRRLVKQYPQVVAYSLWLGLMERSLGRTLGELGQLQEARTLLEGATASVHAMWKKDPRLEGVRTFLGMAYRDLAVVLDRCGEPALAAEARRKGGEFRN